MHSLRGIAAWLISPGLLLAQTSTWSATPSRTALAWSDPANWSAGVPAGHAAVALVPGQPAPVTIITLNEPTTEVGEIRFGPAPVNTAAYAPIVRISEGRQLVVAGAGVFSSRETGEDIQVANGTLVFGGQAVLSARVLAADSTVWYGWPITVRFTESSIHRGVIVLGGGRGVANLLFEGDSVWDGGAVYPSDSSVSRTNIEFRDQATVRAGDLTYRYGGWGHGINVVGQPDLSGLAITAPYDPALGSVSLNLQAATGAISVRRTEGNVQIQLGQHPLVYTNVPDNGCVLTGTVTGNGSLRFESTNAGPVRITNPANDYTGDTFVGSTVVLDGGRLRQVQVSHTGRLALGHSSTIGGDLTVDGGTVTLLGYADTTATLRVTGDYRQAAGSLVLRNFSPPVLLVDGQATLGGDLRLSGPPIDDAPGTHRYPVITAAGGISGQFASTTGLTDTAMLHRRLVYGENDVAILSEQRPFSGVAGNSPAAAALGAHLDTILPSATGGLRDLLVGLNGLATETSVRQSLDSLAPDRYAVLPALARTEGSQRRVAMHRLADPSSSRVFFDVRGRAVRLKATAALPGVHGSEQGALAGVIWRTGQTTLGAFVDSSRTKVDLDAAGSLMRDQALTAGLMARTHRPGFDLGVSFAHGWHDYSLNRRISTPGATALAAAAPAGRALEGTVFVGKTASHGNWRLAAESGLAWTDWQLDGFQEKNAAAAALSTDDWRSRSLCGYVSLHLDHRPDAKIFPFLSLDWLHELTASSRYPTRLSSAPGAPYLAPGRPTDPEEWRLGMGLRVRVASGISLQLNAGLLSSRQQSATLQGSLSLSRAF